MGGDTLSRRHLAEIGWTDGKSWQEWASGMLRPVLALTLVVATIIISYAQSLGLEMEVTVSIGRAFVQLTIIGFVLQFIFNQATVVWIFVAYLFMITVAAYTAGRRAKNVPHAKYVAGVSILIGTFSTMVLLVLLRVFPFTPRYIIPVAGMSVGKAMAVTGVTLKRLREELRQQQGLIETSLALGATPRQAIVKQMRRSLVIGLAPTLDMAKTIGLITMPGAMTGLIMGGASPMEAIQLQIVVMNMLLGASAFSSVLATNLGWRFFFTETYQLQTKHLIAE